jgi:hypothetical protein
MSTNKVNQIKSIEDLKKLEVVSSNVSEKYVPIYTSQIIEELSPEFEFVRATKYFPGGTRHEAVLRTTLFNENGDFILIENSYDRSRSFRLSFLNNGILIPLNLEKIVHRGENAQNLANDLLVNKDEVLAALENAKKIVAYFKSTKISKKLKKEIFEIVFEKHLEKRYEVDVTIADSYDTIFKYIETIVDRYINGEYFIANKSTNKIRKGTKIKSRFTQMNLTNKIYKYLKDNFPAIFI